MAFLVLVRHGQTEWNALGLFTGQTDVPLTELGIKQAKIATVALRDIELHQGYTSELSRAQDTLRHIIKGVDRPGLPITVHPALNERNYGIFEGQSHVEATHQHGAAAVYDLRRSWDKPIEQGESLKDVHDRVVPYYKEHILTDLKAGKNVIVSAHGNTLRALVKHLESIPESEMSALEIGTGEVYVYEIDPETGQIVAKDIKVTGGKA